MKFFLPSRLNSALMTPIARTSSRPGAFSCTAILLVIVATIALHPYSAAEARQVALPGPQCHPSVVRSMPERIRKICDALKVIWDFNDSMETYLDEKGSNDIEEDSFAPMADRRPNWNSGVKRQDGEDVDHVFLRFGKRG